MWSTDDRKLGIEATEADVPLLTAAQLAYRRADAMRLSVRPPQPPIHTCAPPPPEPNRCGSWWCAPTCLCDECFDLEHPAWAGGKRPTTEQAA